MRKTIEGFGYNADTTAIDKLMENTCLGLAVGFSMDRDDPEPEAEEPELPFGMSESDCCGYMPGNIDVI